MESVYKQAIIECWKCGKRIPVFTWKGHQDWQKEKPPEPIPNVLQLRYSSVVDHEYWVNVCPYCNRIQGDWYLYYEPDGPFF
jgi:hypothetical protein